MSEAHSAPISDRTEDSYVMRMLTSPPVVSSQRGRRIVAISPEEIATRMLDWTVGPSRLHLKWSDGGSEETHGGSSGFFM